MSQTFDGFAPEDGHRGTLGLLWGCFWTTFFCSLASLHLDEPSSSSKFYLTLRKTGWIIWSIFAPEHLVIVAFDQWLFARQTLQTMRKHHWTDATMTEAHFLSMGGVCLGTGEGSESIEDSESTQKRIHYTHVERLVETSDFRKAFPTERGMRWRSYNKMSFGLTLTALQTLWFLSQFLERKMRGHSGSILEVYTVSFVLIALLSSVFWMRKPMDVSPPVIVDLEDSIDDSDVVNKYDFQWTRRPKGLYWLSDRQWVTSFTPAS